MADKIRREKYRADRECNFCKQTAVWKFKVVIDRKVHTSYGCKGHEKRAKDALKPSW